MKLIGGNRTLLRFPPPRPAIMKVERREAEIDLCHGESVAVGARKIGGRRAWVVEGAVVAEDAGVVGARRRCSPKFGAKTERRSAPR